VATTPRDPVVEPPIQPGYDPAAPREREIPGRVLLPPTLRTRVAAFDTVVDRQFDRLRGNPVADRLFYDASELADFSLIWHLVGVTRGVLWSRREHETLRLVVCMGAESVLVNGVIKSLFRRTRPTWDFDHARPRRLRRPRSSSFPSGHASAAFTAAGLLSEDDRAWPVYYAAALVVASSRVHVKIHHASDVAAGAALGVVLGRVLRRVWPLRNAE
jgi:undecaprenyl-diphosphatase